jgi:hypothetical protein
MPLLRRKLLKAASAVKLHEPDAFELPPVPAQSRRPASRIRAN